MVIAFARILNTLLPPPEGGVPEDFIYNGTRGEAGWIQRNRDMITPDMVMRALRDKWNLQIFLGPAAAGSARLRRPVTTFEEANFALRVRMGLEWAVPPSPGNPGIRTQPDLFPDDLGSFLSEDLFTMMESRIRTADAVAA